MPILAQNFLMQDNFDRGLGKYYLSEISLWLYRISYDFSVLYFCCSIYHEILPRQWVRTNEYGHAGRHVCISNIGSQKKL